MYKGNGECREFPVPKGLKGTALVFSVGGRAVILKKGEGFTVEGGKFVFVEPPPEGAVIYPGTEAAGEAISSSGVMTRIVDGIAQVSVMLESARLQHQSAELLVKDTVEEIVRIHERQKEDFRAIVLAEMDTVDKAHAVRLESIAKDFAAQIADQLQEMRELREDAVRSVGAAKEHAKRAECEADVAKEDVYTRVGKAVKLCEEIAGTKDYMLSLRDDAAKFIEKHRDDSVATIAAAIADGVRQAEEIRDGLFSSLCIASDRAEQAQKAVDAITSGAGKILERTRR